MRRILSLAMLLFFVGFLSAAGPDSSTSTISQQDIDAAMARLQQREMARQAAGPTTAPASANKWDRVGQYSRTAMQKAKQEQLNQAMRDIANIEHGRVQLSYPGQLDDLRDLAASLKTATLEQYRDVVAECDTKTEANRVRVAKEWAGSDAPRKMAAAACASWKSTYEIRSIQVDWDHFKDSGVSGTTAYCEYPCRFEYVTNGEFVRVHDDPIRLGLDLGSGVVDIYATMDSDDVATAKSYKASDKRWKANAWYVASENGVLVAKEIQPHD